MRGTATTGARQAADGQSFDQCVTSFIGASREQREAAVGRVVEVAGATGVRVLAGALVRRLGRASVAARLRIIEALAGLGPAAVPMLTCALLKARGPTL